jgi:hypothetical protein
MSIALHDLTEYDKQQIQNQQDFEFQHVNNRDSILTNAFEEFRPLEPKSQDTYVQNYMTSRKNIREAPGHLYKLLFSAIATYNVSQRVANLSVQQKANSGFPCGTISCKTRGKEIRNALKWMSENLTCESLASIGKEAAVDGAANLVRDKANDVFNWYNKTNVPRNLSKPQIPPATSAPPSAPPSAPSAPPSAPPTPAPATSAPAPKKKNWFWGGRTKKKKHTRRR